MESRPCELPPVRPAGQNRSSNSNRFDRIPAGPRSLTIASQSLGGELQREAGILQGLSAMESSHRAFLQRFRLRYCSTRSCGDGSSVVVSTCIFECDIPREGPSSSLWRDLASFPALQPTKGCKTFATCRTRCSPRQTIIISQNQLNKAPPTTFQGLQHEAFICS